MTKVLGYGRISTNEGQDVSSQRKALEQHGAVVVFCDIGSGSKVDGRPNLETALRLLDKGDVLLALHPDRIARDTGDLLAVARRVVEQGAVLRIVDPTIVFDGQDIMAEMMLTLFGLVGRVEKYFLRARQRRGIEAARERGVYRGRPASIDPLVVRQLRQQGLGASAIAKRLAISRASVYRVLEEKGLELPAAG